MFNIFFKLWSKLKSFLIIVFLLALFVFINACSYVSAVSSNISENVFRLHVIANSDSVEDQNLKYIVRDAVINFVNSSNINVSSKEELISNLDLDAIKSIAQNTVWEYGFSYPVSVELGYFDFPTKNYGDVSLPAGFYDALRIKIGDSCGQNWWCVMFPPLCFVDVSSGIVPDGSKEILEENLDSERLQFDC